MTIEDLLIHFQYGDEEDEESKQPSRQFYCPGDELRGIVSLHLGLAVKVTDVTVHFLGIGNVAWEATHKRKTYSSQEIYLDAAKPLLDIGYDRTVNLPPGLHQFGFRYHLPSDLPSTFNGVYGSVIYTAKVKVECQDERNSTVSSEPFLVLRRPELGLGVYEEKRMKKSKYLLGLNSGKVKVQCAIDKSAAIPGGSITIDADVSNWTGRQITLIQAAAVQESSYYARGKKIVFRQYLNTRDDVFDTGFLSGRRWHHVLLPLPPFLPDSGLEACRIMDVDYSFQFKVQIDGKDDLVLETPIYVGKHSAAVGAEGKDLLLGKMWEGLAAMQPSGQGPPDYHSTTLYQDYSDNHLYANVR